MSTRVDVKVLTLTQFGSHPPGPEYSHSWYHHHPSSVFHFNPQHPHQSQPSQACTFKVPLPLAVPSARKGFYHLGPDVCAFSYPLSLCIQQMLTEHQWQIRLFLWWLILVVSLIVSRTCCLSGSVRVVPRWTEEEGTPTPEWAAPSCGCPDVSLMWLRWEFYWLLYNHFSGKYQFSWSNKH